MATLSTRPVLGTAPADDDYIHIVDRSDLTGSPQGTSYQQNIDVLRTLGNFQVIDFNGIGTLGSDGSDIELDFSLVGSAFQIRNNVNVDIFTIGNTGNVVIPQGNLDISLGALSVATGIFQVLIGDVNVGAGDINMTSGDLIVQAGNIDVQAGGADLNGTLDMNNNAIQNISGMFSNSPLFITIANLFGGVSMTGVGNSTYTINADITSLSGDLNITSGGITKRSGAADPLPAEVSEEHYILFENTVSQEFAFWANNGGVMQRSAPLNYLINQAFTPTITDFGGTGTYIINGSNISIYDRVDGNKIYINIVITNINSVLAPTGELRIPLNTPFPYVRSSGIDVYEFTGSDVSFYSVNGVIVDNGGNPEVRLTIQQALDGNFTGGMGSVTLTASSIRLTGYVYI